ncbi:MAG: hypothetical protein AAF065_01735 [Verrucomicrobiota bacterium]
MRNIFILYIPPTNVEAVVHYEDTIKKRVDPQLIASHVEPSLNRRLQSIFGPSRVAVWGSRDSLGNRSKFDRMRPGDEILIVEGKTIKLLGRIAEKTVSPALSRDIWKNLRGDSSAGWDLIYFIANPREINLPFSEFCKLVGYKEDFQLHGFTGVSQDRLDNFYGVYDDLYSILTAIKEGYSYSPLVDPEAVKRTLDDLDDLTETPAPQDEQETIDNPSDHVRIQWMLLKMGINAGEKVWAPRGDQGRIRAAYDFDQFENEFAGGLDTQVKYVENIDVVWKDQYRIDAAFEVENSTSIYSGLLRFADLTMVAPNSRYPLFIVAPEERRSRVRSQVARPTFKHLNLDERVRFLSYSKLQEIDDFVGPSGTGVNVELLEGKADRLAS